MADRPESSELRHDNAVNRFQKRFDSIQNKNFESETDIDRELTNLQDIIRDLEQDKRIANETAQKVEMNLNAKRPEDRTPADDQSLIDALNQVTQIEGQIQSAQDSIQNLENRRKEVRQGSGGKLDRLEKRIERRAERGTQKEKEMVGLQEKINAIDLSQAKTPQEKIALLQQRQELQTQLDRMERREDRTEAMEKARALKILEEKIEKEEAAYADALADSLQNGTPAPVAPAESVAPAAPAPGTEKAPESTERFNGSIDDITLGLAKELSRNAPDSLEEKVDVGIKGWLLRFVEPMTGPSKQWAKSLDAGEREILKNSLGLTITDQADGTCKTEWGDADPAYQAPDWREQRALRDYCGNKWMDALKYVDTIPAATPNNPTLLEVSTALANQSDPKIKAGLAQLLLDLNAKGAKDSDSFLDAVKLHWNHIPGRKAAESSTEKPEDKDTDPLAEARDHTNALSDDVEASLKMIEDKKFNSKTTFREFLIAANETNKQMNADELTLLGTDAEITASCEKLVAEPKFLNRMGFLLMFSKDPALQSIRSDYSDDGELTDASKETLKKTFAPFLASTMKSVGSIPISNMLEMTATHPFLDAQQKANAAKLLDALKANDPSTENPPSPSS